MRKQRILCFNSIKWYKIYYYVKVHSSQVLFAPETSPTFLLLKTKNTCAIKAL